MLSVPTSQGNVIIDIPDINEAFKRPNKNVGIKVSGGADSAIMAYMLAIYARDYKPHLSIFPITSENPIKPYQIIFAKRVIAKIEDLTNFKFGEHYTDILPGIDDYGVEQSKIITNLYLTNKVDCHFMGETRNPPLEVMAKWPVGAGAMPPERNVDQPVADLRKKSFRPLRTFHKQSIRELYEYFGVIDTLFPVTRSCEDITTDFTAHCNTCCFCFERQWGFGRLI
jgi:hypothetical protein